MDVDQRRTHREQQKPSKQPLWRNWRDLSGVTLCIAVSVLCIGVCVVVFVRTSELQSRIVSLEQQQLSAWMLSLEQVEPVIMGRLDRILEEVSRLLQSKHIRNIMMTSYLYNICLLKERNNLALVIEVVFQFRLTPQVTIWKK